MIIDGEKFSFVDTLDSTITVLDCFVKSGSTIGSGHGEAKLYIGSKSTMNTFFGSSGFNAKCFLPKTDMIFYMNALRQEYLHPSQPYRATNEMPELWKERMNRIDKSPNVIEFVAHSQNQITGDRGYVNSKDPGYQLIREISLPLVSYISIVQLTDSTGLNIHYWKLFADFDAISDKREALVHTFGKKSDSKASFTPVDCKPYRTLGSG